MFTNMDMSKVIFGNDISKNVCKKAEKSKRKYIRKFGDDSNEHYHLTVEENKSIGDMIGVKDLVMSSQPLDINVKNPIIIGNIRMGFGHYRMSMAIASCAYHMGYTPLWFDLLSYSETTGAKVIEHQNNLYSNGSRMSQKSRLFNRLIWEPLNYEGFKKLSYNAVDQKNTELMIPIFNDIDRDIPFVATHVWPAQAAVHAGMKNVVNAIPDNWAMALHFSQGAIHAVQTDNVYLWYRTLKGMDKNKTLNCMPKGSLYKTGNYIDHELVSNVETDCNSRIERIKARKAKRYLLTIGGAGAQKEIFAKIIKKLLPEVKKNKACIYVNIGDYENVWRWLCQEMPELSDIATKHFNNFDETKSYAEKALTEDVCGIHIFCHKNIFEAVYSTNLLMRSTDLLITKPSELAFYPVPKLFIKRVGKHEMWGAIHSSEMGDGTPELRKTSEVEQMLDLMISDDSIITNMCKCIIRNKNNGIYNGGYEVVKLATKQIR